MAQQKEMSKVAQILESIRVFFKSGQVFKRVCIFFAIILIIVGIFATIILGGMDCAGPGGFGCSYKGHVEVKR